MPILLFLLTIFSRLPFTSKYLYHLDSGHFAFALDNSDLSLHQPHPPGYFLYIMLGRLVHLAINDANSALVTVSIFFSALTVVTVYFLGKELFDERIGIYSALLTLTSPNFWFHGEVALTYPAEAFFSALIGLYCWRAYQGNKKYVLLSAIMLAVASGFRQNTAVFLFPLWLFSVRKESFRSIVSGLVLFGIVSFAWFLPMIIYTGGLSVYIEAFRELLVFNTGNNSVFEKGLPALKLYSQTIYNFIFFSMGAALPVLLLAVYSAFRNQRIALLNNTKTYFFAVWVLPSGMFYLLFFIHPANPGYILILLPPLMLIASVALSSLCNDLRALTKLNFAPALFWLLILFNSSMFLFSRYPVTRYEVQSNDKNLANLFNALRHFNPQTTLILVAGPYIFRSFRHIMVYLPEYTVYQVDIRMSPSGESRKFFGGELGKTILVKKIPLPSRIKYFASVVYAYDKNTLPLTPPGLSVVKVDPDYFIVSGPITRVSDLFPKLSPYLETLPFILSTDSQQSSKENRKGEALAT